MAHEHIVKKFDKNLDKIKASIVEMGSLVALQINDATAVLLSYDAAEAKRIAAYDRIINGLNKDIHDRAEILIIRRQPMALDLRQTLAPINISGELERIGDHAKSTAKRAHIIGSNRPDDALLEMISQMSEVVQVMLAEVITAYESADLELAASVREQDQKVDELNNQLLQMAIKALAKNSEQAESLIHLILISRNFERIGDHITNIARYVHQIATGDDLKAAN